MLKQNGMTRTIVLTLLLIVVMNCGGTAPATLGNDTIASADVATQGGNFSAPRDSIPNPNASVIYFTAKMPEGNGVLQVPASGGEAKKLVAGSPFVAPRGIEMSGDGKQIFVADPEANAIFVTAVSDGTTAALRGTNGTTPRGLAVIQENGTETLYFTGNAPNDGQPALFKIPTMGADIATIVAKGAPLVMPDGLAVTQAGTVYVSDLAAAGNSLGSVFRLNGTTLTKISDNLKLGNPAGIALTLDDSVLLVSSLNREKGSDQVLLIALASQQTGIVTQVVEANHAAGGVHRARNVNVFSWIDSEGGGQGIVYRIKPK